MNLSEGLATPPERVDEWLREGVDLLRYVIAERDSLRDRAGAAEHRSEQLSGTAAQLERDVTRLQSEIDHLNRERAEFTEAVRNCMTEVDRSLAEVRRLMNDVVSKFRR
jgi:phage shock protein A